MKNKFIKKLLIILMILVAVWIALKLFKSYKESWDKKVLEIEKDYDVMVKGLEQEIFEIQKAKAVVVTEKGQAEIQLEKVVAELEAEKRNIKIKYKDKEIPVYVYEHKDLKKCNENFNLCIQAKDELQGRFDIYKELDEDENIKYQERIDEEIKLKITYKSEAEKNFQKLKRQKPIAILMGIGAGILVYALLK